MYRQHSPCDAPPHRRCTSSLAVLAHGTARYTLVSLCSGMVHRGVLSLCAGTARCVVVSSWRISSSCAVNGVWRSIVGGPSSKSHLLYARGSLRDASPTFVCTNERDSVSRVLCWQSRFFFHNCRLCVGVLIAFAVNIIDSVARVFSFHDVDHSTLPTVF